jgi:hypothetical protein
MRTLSQRLRRVIIVANRLRVLHRQSDKEELAQRVKLINIEKEVDLVACYFFENAGGHLSFNPPD